MIIHAVLSNGKYSMGYIVSKFNDLSGPSKACSLCCAFIAAASAYAIMEHEYLTALSWLSMAASQGDMAYMSRRPF